MSQRPAVLQEQQLGQGIFTVRSILLGAFLCFVIGVAGPYWTFYLHSSTLFLDYSVGGAMFLLFITVLLFNGFLGMIRPSLALQPGELIVAMGMMLVAGAITTMGLMGYLIPTITVPYSHADPVNQWQEKLWPHLAPWTAPLDPDGGIRAIMLFDQGIHPKEVILVEPWTFRGLIQSAQNFVRVTSSMPWEPWLTPMVYWAIFLMALYACMISVMTIMRKQWIDYERLSYPIAQVPQELCASAAAPWAPGSLLRNKMFWFGFGMTFFFGCLTALHKLPGYEWVPALTQSTQIPGVAPLRLYLYLSFAVLGFTFLIPNRVAFSLWFLNLASYAFRTFLKKNALDVPANLGLYGAVGWPNGTAITGYQGMGAMLVFVAGSLYFARRHLKRVLLCALAQDRFKLLGASLAVVAGLGLWRLLGGGAHWRAIAQALAGRDAQQGMLWTLVWQEAWRLLLAALLAVALWGLYALLVGVTGVARKGEKDYDANEPSSYTTALIMFVLSMLVMAVWLNEAGLPLLHTIVFLCVCMIIFYGITRVVAQCGLSVTIAPLLGPPFMTAVFGGANIEAKGIGALTQSWVWMSDIRTTVMSSSAHAMYLTRRKGRGLIPLLLVAALITFVVAAAATVWLGYRHGAANLADWFFVSGPPYTFDWGMREITTKKPPLAAGYLWTGVGAAIMGGLIIAQRSLLWWPIHPVGFIVCSVYWTDVLWLTILFAWAIKLLVTRIGGNKMLRSARRFFLGMILGQFTVAGVWAIYDTLTGTLNHGIFWI